MERPKRTVFPLPFANNIKSIFINSSNYSDDFSRVRYRHYISWGILNGDDIYQIATNCGNTVGVIQNHYAKELVSRDFEEDLSTLRIIK